MAQKSVEDENQVRLDELAKQISPPSERKPLLFVLFALLLGWNLFLLVLGFVL